MGLIKVPLPVCSELQHTEPEVRPPLGGGALDFQAVPTIQQE